MYFHGEGVEANKRQAAELYTQSSDQGHVISQYNLGHMYYRGEGVPVDKARALSLFTLAADQGHLPAMNCLGFMLIRGDGVEEDRDRAVRLFDKAADRAEIGLIGSGMLKVKLRSKLNWAMTIPYRFLGNN